MSDFEKITIDGVDYGFKDSVARNDVSDLKSAVSHNNDDLNALTFVEDGTVASSSGYYMSLPSMQKGKSYKLEITTATSGTYTLAFGTSNSSETLVDTVGSYAFVANTPRNVYYTPSDDGLVYARLWMCSNWSVSSYILENLHEKTDQNAEDIAENTADIVEIKSILNPVVNAARSFCENGQAASSGYYKYLPKMQSGKTYELEVTATTSGTYTLAFGPSTTGSELVDTVYSGSFVANTPKRIMYTPSAASLVYARLWVCDSWTITTYTYDNLNAKIEENTEDIAENTASIEEIDSFIDDSFTKVYHKNRLNESAIIKNKRYDSSGALVDISGWDTSNAIPVAANETIYFSLDDDGTRKNTGMWYLILLSDNNIVLDYDNSGVTSYTASQAGFVHFTWKYAATKTDLFCGDVSDPSYYDTYGYDYVANRAKGTEKPYEGVVWVCVGDSMTEANSTAAKHYFDYIAEELGFTTINKGVGGTGYAADRANSRAFYQRIPNITEPFDVLTIFGSVNDLSVIGTGSGQMPLGTYDDSGLTTVAGYINAAIDAFYTLAPFKKIGIISQPPSVGSANNGHLLGTNAQSYNDLLEQICKNRGIPFLNIFNCSGLRPWDADYREEYYNEDGRQDSGVHPNSKGQKQLSTKIREFIKTVI